MQLLVKKVFNQNEIKETHKSKHNAYKKDLYVFIATTDRPKILKILCHTTLAKDHYSRVLYFIFVKKKKCLYGLLGNNF